MKKTPKEIAGEINALVDELVRLAEEKGRESSGAKKIVKEAVGATGGLRSLVAEGYFDQPRELAPTMERLRQDGRHYPRATTAMGLLALVRERILTRFRGKDNKNWQYAKRK